MKSKLFSLIAICVLFTGVVGFINLNSLQNYSAQSKPQYIVKSNSPANNPITDKGATLGRVLFYDKKLSANMQVSCGSCHKQEFAFGDTATQSKGHLGGLTDRHSMRLANARFSIESRFFWDERAITLEFQTTQPIRNAVEMGYSGNNGQYSIDSLITRLKKIGYYQSLFSFVYGDSLITENRIQLALAQFVRSIQSFDSKFDQGFSTTNNLNINFPNYTQLENQGKNLFLTAPPAGGAGCQGCHRAPEFDIDPNSHNNGVITVAGNPGATDITNTKAPSLRNLFNPLGFQNGPLMHDGSKKNILDVIDHYNNIPFSPVNTNLDPRLQGPGGHLNLSIQQKGALVAFLKTLSGNALYTDSRWSDPFDNVGNLSISTGVSEITINSAPVFQLYPNPSNGPVQVLVKTGQYTLSVFDTRGRLVKTLEITGGVTIETDGLNTGIYYFVLRDNQSGLRTTKKLVVE